MSLAVTGRLRLAIASLPGAVVMKQSEASRCAQDKLQQELLRQLLGW